MSKKPIFTDPRNGGRKANLLASMVKKTEANLASILRPIQIFKKTSPPHFPATLFRQIS